MITNCQTKVIIVLDENTTRGKHIVHNLNRNNFISIYAKDIISAEQYCSEYSPDLVLILSSLNINEMLNFSKRLKICKPSCKILLSSTINIYPMLEECFKNGIDDYIPDPINPYELYAKIKKNLSFINNYEFLEFHGIKLNITYSYIIINNVKIYLSSNEVKIMEQLMTSRESINISFLCKNTSNSSSACRMCIQRLRQKFKSNTGMEIIKSRYGVGYYISI